MGHPREYSWFGRTYNKIKDWSKKPKVQKFFLLVELVIVVSGLIYLTFSVDQIQDIALPLLDCTWSGLPPPSTPNVYFTC